MNSDANRELEEELAENNSLEAKIEREVKKFVSIAE